MDFDFSVITEHWRFLASGIGVTLVLSVVSGLTSIVAGFVVALLRLYGPRWLRPIVVLYIDSMRAIPVLVVLVWTFFALPIVTGLTMPPFFAALIGLTVHLAAYVAAIVRAGVESVRPGQTRASLALGMSRAQIVRRIVLPQAIVRMLPAFGSLLSINILGGGVRCWTHRGTGTAGADLRCSADRTHAGLPGPPWVGRLARNLAPRPPRDAFQISSLGEQIRAAVLEKVRAGIGAHRGADP